MAETVSDFAEGQWWLQELDAMVASGTDDQKRAVAVVRNLLRTAQSAWSAGYKHGLWQGQHCAPEPLAECHDSDSPWLVCKHCHAAGKCDKQPAASGEPVAWMYQYTYFPDSPEDAPARTATSFHQNPNAPEIAKHTPLYAAQPTPARVPPGGVLVPVEPTRAMLDAAGRCAVQEGQAWLDADARATWAAMLAAANDAQKGKP